MKPLGGSHSRRVAAALLVLICFASAPQHAQQNADNLFPYRYTIDELGIGGSAFVRIYGGGVSTKVNLVLFEFVHRRLVLEHNKLAVVLKSGLKSGRHLGQVRVTDVLAFLVDDTSTVASSNEQAAFGDLREESVAITILGKGLKLRIDLIPFLP